LRQHHARVQEDDCSEAHAPHTRDHTHSFTNNGDRGPGATD
jgi:hypothetical protein